MSTLKNMNKQNPLIFRDRPKIQCAATNKDSIIYEQLGMLPEMIGELLGEETHAQLQTRAQATQAVQKLEDMYDEAWAQVDASGLGDLVRSKFGLLPAAPRFDLEIKEVGEDQPHPSKFGGIPDFRGDFLFTHPKLIREAHGDADYVPSWVNDSPETVLARLWPTDADGSFMRFAAQAYMPAHMWDIFYRSGAWLAEDYGDRKVTVTPMGYYPSLAMNSQYAYVFYAKDMDFSPRLTACVDFSVPEKKDDIMPWEEYVELVKKVVPVECYAMEDGSVTSAPLGEAQIGLDLDCDNMWGKDSFYSQAKESNACWDIMHLSLGEGSKLRESLTIGGRPSSQQEEKRPWDHMAFGEPRRMVPFCSFSDRDHDVTHQVYLSGYRVETSQYWGQDDASCT
ncbi:MAG: hypothetical protein JSS66_07670 [Armatimonadetes bacterium]|nr:hypothetical protein [Armatimonadota bacterium]